MPKITTKQAIDSFDKLITELKTLYKKDIQEGTIARLKLENRIRSIIKLAFDDSKEKIEAYNRSAGITVIDQVIAKKEGEARSIYVGNLRRVEEKIEDYVDELKLIYDLEQQSSKLDKTEADIEKASKEAERRGHVADSKFYGAYIEIIDRLRDELKGRKDYSKEIAALKSEINNLKNEIVDLRNKLYLLAEDQRVDLDILQAERDDEIKRAEAEEESR